MVVLTILGVGGITYFHIGESNTTTTLHTAGINAMENISLSPVINSTGSTLFPGTNALPGSNLMVGNHLVSRSSGFVQISSVQLSGMATANVQISNMTPGEYVHLVVNITNTGTQPIFINTTNPSGIYVNETGTTSLPQFEGTNFKMPILNETGSYFGLTPPFSEYPFMLPEIVNGTGTSSWTVASFPHSTSASVNTLMNQTVWIVPSSNGQLNYTNTYNPGQTFTYSYYIGYGAQANPSVYGNQSFSFSITIPLESS